ncbi:MAG: hypothetical protein RL095_2978 [Verrucomicrobiota bacterium]|jgi:lipid-A-disaccharide synthase-like uncharacterized protein
MNRMMLLLALLMGLTLVAAETAPQNLPDASSLPAGISLDIEEVDSNHDGKISGDEITAALAPHQPKPADWYKWMWKCIGWGGAGMFGLRWLVQFWASKKAGKPTIPISFWIISVCGALMSLSYFIFYKNDSVGIIGNALPALVAAYNLRLALKHRQDHPADADLDSAVVDREESEQLEDEKKDKNP